MSTAAARRPVAGNQVSPEILDLLVEQEAEVKKLDAERLTVERKLRAAGKALDRTRTTIFQAVGDGAELPDGWEIHERSEPKQERWGAASVELLVRWLTRGEVTYETAKDCAVKEGWIGGTTLIREVLLRAAPTCLRLFPGGG